GYVEIPAIGENAGIEQLILELMPVALAIGRHELGIGIGLLWIFVEIAHVGMCRRIVEVEVVLLHILAVIAFGIGETEQALLEDRVLAVPQSDGEAEELAVVGDAGNAILAPAIGARPRLVVGEIIPGIAVGAVILAHRAPLALGEVGSPFAPRGLAVAAIVEARLLGVLHRDGSVGQ